MSQGVHVKNIINAQLWIVMYIFQWRKKYLLIINLLICINTLGLCVPFMDILV